MIDITKTYRTRDGREVRIYAVDGEGKSPVHGAVLRATGWAWCIWTASGNVNLQSDPCEADLIEVKPRIKREVWVNVYEGGIGNNHSTKEEADSYAHSFGAGRIACVKVMIDCGEGEGL